MCIILNTFLYILECLTAIIDIDSINQLFRTFCLSADVRMLASVYNRNICVFVSTESSIDVDPIPI